MANYEDEQAQAAAALKKQIIRWGTVIVLLAFLFIFSFKMLETVGASEIVVVQYPNGKLEVYNTPGIKFQGFGSITRYKKSFQYWFSKAGDQGGENDESIKVRFNDGGHAQLSGSCRIDLPSDVASIIQLHTKYGSQEAIERALVRTVIEKAVYMTGPLMSSKESSSTKRTDLINFIADQAEKGVYKTRQVEKKVKEDGSDSSKIVTVVELLKDTTGQFYRQEQSPFYKFSIGFSNLSINSLDYDSAVEKQIRSQQDLTMQVQTAMARAKTAEQQVFTTQKEGEAAAAKAKWEQEAIKAQKVTEAEQILAVQELATKTAAQYKQQQILEGEGDAEKKRLIMNANGALDVKLDAYVKVMEAAWSAIGAYTGNWVPTYWSGGGSAPNGAFNTMEALNIKLLRDLNIDLTNKK